MIGMPSAPFFRLPGRIALGRDTVRAEVRPESVVGSRASLSGLCQRVQAARPQLPDGQRFLLREASVCCLT